MPSNDDGSDAARFRYIGEDIGLIFGLYISSIILIISFLFCCRKRDYTIEFNEYNSIVNSQSQGEGESFMVKWKRITIEYFSGAKFESVYLSYLGTNSKNFAILLCITRLLSFLFFITVPVIWDYVREKGYNWIYLTFWSIDLITIYFFLAFISSVIGLIKKPDAGQNLTTESESNWNQAEQFLGVTVQFLFQIVGATAFFITVFVYTILTKDTDFWNVSYHLMNTFAMLLEMSLNSLIVRWEYLLINLSWIILYAIYIWPMVATHVITTWPYDALSTRDSSSLVWYIILYVLVIVFFFVWYLLSRLKIYFRGAAFAPLLQLKLAQTGSVAAIIVP